MERTLSELIAEMDRIEALSEQLTPRDKSQITKLYNNYKGNIQPNLQALAARVYDAAINDKQLSSSDASQAKQVYNQVMPQIPGPVKAMYSGIINRGMAQLEKSASAAPAQQPAQASAAPAQQPAQTSSAVSGGTLRRGAKGQAVVDLQNKLGIEADGQYGPGTAEAVKKFQQENGLDVDGVVGPNTLAALNSEPAAQQPAAQQPAASADNTAQQSSGPDDGSRAGQEPNRPVGNTTDEPTQQPAQDNGFDFGSAKQVGGRVYKNDADAIEGLMAKSARTPEEESYLAMLARKHNFYGKPENIGPAIEKIRNSIGEATQLDRISQLAGLT